MSDRNASSTVAGAPPPDEQNRVEVAAEHAGDTSSESTLVRILASPAGRNAGLIIALVLLIIVGIVTAGDRFASTNNMLTILRLASVIGVVSIGMTFVITGGGIDLSVGAIVALCSVWATTLATQTMAADTHWSLMVFVALAVGASCGLVNGLLIAYGRIAPFIATLAMLAAARGLAEIIAKRRTQIVTVREFVDFFGASIVGVPVLVIIFALVSAGGWVLLNRTTFGRRTLAVGGNIEAARLAGINVRRHTALLYVLLGRRVRYRRRDAHRPHDDRQLDTRNSCTSWTRSPPSSSAARCSAAAAERSSGRCSECSSSRRSPTSSRSTTSTPRTRQLPRAQSSSPRSCSSSASPARTRLHDPSGCGNAAAPAAHRPLLRT